jgi:hypothetical protein
MDAAATATQHAHQAYVRARGNMKRAVELLERMIRADDKLYKEVLDPLLHEACVRLIHAANAKQRMTAWTSVEIPTERDGRSAIDALASGTIRALNLMDFPLPGGKPLGDANRQEVIAGARFYAKQANDMAQKAAWLRLVADRMTGRKLVKNCLSVEELLELQEESKPRPKYKPGEGDDDRPGKGV